MVHNDTKVNHKAYVEDKEEKKEVKQNKKISRIEDFIEDIKDDGKRNYSHDPNRKSPGRKKNKKDLLKKIFK